MGRFGGVMHDGFFDRSRSDVGSGTMDLELQGRERQHRQAVDQCPHRQGLAFVFAVHEIRTRPIRTGAHRLQVHLPGRHASFRAGEGIIQSARRSRPAL